MDARDRHDSQKRGVCIAVWSLAEGLGRFVAPCGVQPDLGSGPKNQQYRIESRKKSLKKSSERSCQKEKENGNDFGEEI